MKLEFTIKTPPTYGEIVTDYLKVLEENELYDAWTINENLEVVQCKGSIRNNGSWNYHNNYDNSENELYVIWAKDRKTEKKWFSLNKAEVVQVQKENVKTWKSQLKDELIRLENLF